MRNHSNIIPNNKRQSASTRVPLQKVEKRSGFPFTDLRQTAVVQRKIQEAARKDPRAAKMELFQKMASHPKKQLSNVSAQPIQRYTVVPADEQDDFYWGGLGADLRVADDGTMAVKDTPGRPQPAGRALQDFFATPEVLQHSASVLEQQQSGFSINQGSQSIMGPEPQAVWANPDTPENLLPTNLLYRAEISNIDLAGTQQQDTDLSKYSFQACSQNFLNTIGVYRTQDVGNGGPQDNDVLTKTCEEDGTSLAIPWEKKLETGMNIIRKMMTGEKDLQKAKVAYDALGETARDFFADIYKVNQYAEPEVGEGFGLFAGGVRKGGTTAHFAPVIAASGGDRVTLENVAGIDHESMGTRFGKISPNWFLRMTGPVKIFPGGIIEDQTFYAEKKRNDSERVNDRGIKEKYYGESPLVVRMGPG